MIDVTLSVVQHADKLLKDHAQYQADPKLRDSWDSYATQVLRGESFQGDCDDWSMTALEILYNMGVPKDRLYRAMVSTTGEAIDHMVGIVELSNGERWTVGDTFSAPRRVVGSIAGNHRIMQTSRMDERRSGLPLWRYWSKVPMSRETNTAAMMMSISKRGIDFIKGHEMFMARAYDDFRPRYVLKAGDRIQGTLTIGYGHTGRDVTVGMVWTESQALAALDKDLDRFEAAVRKLVRVPLSQDQFDALTSFCFNCGEANLASSTLLKKINAKAPTSEIQAQFRRWNKSKGKVLRGLVLRRDAEAGMWGGYAVVTHAEPTPAEPDITPNTLVEETKGVAQSWTVWVLAAIGAMPVVMEAARVLRDMGVEIEVPWLAEVGSTIMAVAAIGLFIKRIYEIAVAARR